MRRPPLLRRPGVAMLLCTALAGAACTTGSGPTSPGTVSPRPSERPTGTVASPAEPGARSAPALQVRRVVRGLSHPWDVAVLPAGQLLVTERDTRRLLVVEDRGSVRELDFPSEEVWSSGETGLMSLAVDPEFDRTRRILTCHGGFPRSGGTDVRVVAWRLDEGLTAATRARVLLAGLPTSTGRHGGCRLLVTDDGALLVGTGDAALSGTSQDLGSLGGKVLRLDPATGRPWPTNPWADHHDRRRRYVLTHGHRNVQGLAQRADGTLWSVEHGPDRDDEVNLLEPGADHGWAPGPGYDESVAMTDTSLPGPQARARWRSGRPTIAASGAAWVHGEQWGRYDDTLAVAALKGERLVLMRFDRGGRLVWTAAPPALQRHGRLRSVTPTPEGDLLLTTDNGEDDAVLRVSPAG